MSRKKTPESIPQKEVESPQNEGKPRPFESLRDIFGLVSAGAGIFAALLYLAGRSFASGYFAAMNIPNYQVSFSLWEYGEVAWLPLLLYPIGMIVVTGFLMGILTRIVDLLSPMIKKIVIWLKTNITVKLPVLNLPESSHETIFWVSTTKRATFILLLIGTVVFTLNFVRSFGQLNGRIHITELSAQVEVISAIPLSLDDNNLPSSKFSGQDFFVYKGLRLLTVNNDKYYLFKEIDPITCKPAKVYVIEARETLQVNLLPAVSIANQCKSTTGQNINSVLATPTTNP